MEHTFVRTRKLTMNQLALVSKWLDEHAMGQVTIQGAPYRLFIQQYIAEHEGNRKIHQVKVQFFNETDSRRFLMDWG